MKTFFKKLEYRFLVALKLKTHHFHAKLSYQKPMLRQIEWWVQNGPITENGVLTVTALFFENFVSVWEPLIKSWFGVPTTQMPIFLLFVSAGVLFYNAFSLWVLFPFTVEL